MAIETLRSLYSENILTPETVVKEVYKRLALPDADPAVWLHVIPEETSIQVARDLLKKYPVPSSRPPLFGIPFSIKDSIDIKGLPTTGACPAYAYTAEKDAPSFVLLVEAGAIPIGKVNLVRLHFLKLSLKGPNLTILAPGPTRHGSCGYAFAIRATCFCILKRLHLWGFQLRFLR